MVYVTVPQTPRYRQMTIDELLFGLQDGVKTTRVAGVNGGTRTYKTERVNTDLVIKADVPGRTKLLEDFNAKTAELRKAPRESLYHHFCIPKRSGGLRPIDAPNEDLMYALRELKRILEVGFSASHHTEAYAYVKKRGTIDAMRLHQKNESKWFLHLDMKHFFNSTTLDFVMYMASMIYPFSEICRYPYGKEQLRTALELGFLHGGLPQGTPLSPMLTNLMMIPIDFTLYNQFRHFPTADGHEQSFICTRYADDFIISSKYEFDPNAVTAYVNSVLNEFHAPFKINEEKTRYGSSSGSNWHLGVIINKENEMSFGYKNRQNYTKMLRAYCFDKQRGVAWDVHDLQHMHGIHSYYKNVNPDVTKQIEDGINKKYNVDVIQMILADITA